MSNLPINLDQHRPANDREAVRHRRQCLANFQADQKALELRQAEFENELMSEPAYTWPQAAAKAQYLIQLFAATPQAQDRQRRHLIDQTLDDLACLCACSADYS